MEIRYASHVTRSTMRRVSRRRRRHRRVIVVVDDHRMSAKRVHDVTPAVAVVIK
jgi:hypothetical protein